MRILFNLAMLAVLGMLFLFCDDGSNARLTDDENAVLELAQNAQSSYIQTYLTLYPSKLTNSSSALFAFSCNRSACAYKCKLDDTGWTRCKSPKLYTGLADGAHIFKVKAISKTGLIDATPAKYSWAIDTIAPETILDSFPANPSELTSATFEFKSNEENVSFECKLDSEDWNECASPKNYSQLASGEHSFSVRAIDLALNTDPTPAGYSWTIQISQKCVDSDQDGYGEHCGNGPDCDDSDPDNWSKCSTCVDKDYDGWYINCDRYENRNGPDCDDQDFQQWQCCNCCPKDCYYTGSCMCAAEWSPVCVSGFSGYCYESNPCWADVYCEQILCYLPIDEFGEIDPNSACAQQHPGCTSQCY